MIILASSNQFRDFSLSTIFVELAKKVLIISITTSVCVAAMCAAQLIVLKMTLAQYVQNAINHVALTSCYRRHKARGVCNKFWRCPTCTKTLDISYNAETNSKKNDPKDHICGDFTCVTCGKTVTHPHYCFMRAVKPKENDLKIIHFDYECRFDDIYECESGYLPFNPTGENCMVCSAWEHGNRCPECRKCQNCEATSCGFAEHKPNLVIAHSSCDVCENEVLDDHALCLLLWVEMF